MWTNLMKTWIPGTAFVMATMLAAGAHASIQDDLIGLWQMDASSGTAAVDAINSNDGTWQDGGDDPGWVAGQIGNAANQNGAENNKWIISEVTQLDGATALTLAGWINTDSISGYRGILMTRTLDENVDVNQNWGIAREGTAPGALWFDVRVSGGALDSASGSLATETWQHVVSTWDASTNTRALYVDGDFVSSNTSSVASIVDSGDWYLGDDNCCGTRTLSGEIDDVGMWRRSLSATEVKAVYDRGQESISAEYAFTTINKGIQQGMVAHWSLDQAAFTTDAFDSKNENHLDVNNVTHATAWVDGAINGALDMPGTSSPSSHVVGAANLGDGATALTLSIWVNADSKSDWDGFLTSSGDFFGLQLDNNGGKDAHFRAMGVPFYSDIELSTGEWYHLVGVWESGVTQQLYVNGVAVAAATGTGAVAGGTADIGSWYIGRDRTFGGREFNGQLDDAAIWTRALTAGEVNLLYTNGLQGLNAQQAIPTPGAAVGGLGLLAMLGLGRRRRA